MFVRIPYLAGAVLLGMAPLLDAQELRQIDSIDHGASAGAPLDGLGGGAGWDGPWIGVDQPGGLLGYYPLDSDASDLGAVGAAGTVNGGAFVVDQPGLAWSTGSYELNVNGADEHIALDAALPNYAGLLTGTIAAWIKTTAGGAATILAASDSTRPSSEIRLLLERGNLLFDVRGDLNSLGLLTSSVSVNDGQWHHVAVVVDGSSFATLYIDGVADTALQQGFFGYVSNLDTMAIGRNVDSGGSQWRFPGQIDDVAIWGSPLTPTEIADLAGGLRRPDTISGVSSLSGPVVEAGGLTSSAFTSRGLSAYGDGIRATDGLRAGRTFLPEIDLRQDRSYYVSALVRREDGAAIVAGDVELSDAGAVRGSFGWDDSGLWRAGIRGAATGTAVMQDRTTYFSVLRIDAVSSGDDSCFLKVYGPGETVDASDAGFDANSWTVVGAASASGARGFTAWVTPVGPGGAMLVDEIRIGDTWDAVTRLGYGTGCLGATIGQSGRPFLGNAAYGVSLSGVAGNAAVALNLGVSRETGAVGALPFDLTPFGAPGCSVLASDEFNFGATSDAAGDAALGLPLPNDPSLLGLALFGQWVAADLGGSNALQVRLSDGLEIVFQG